MKCFRCGNFLYENDYCAECGADVSKYKKIVKKSNELYNRGLEMARVRNMTGAIECLRVSIKMYKANINARNLLGLIYVEIGEYALGLAQWVISKSQQSDNNVADHFLDELQSTRQDLHMMNFTVRKYNKAIGYVNQGNYDLAEIQLKKLLNDNSHLVKGYQLLALLLMRKKKFAEARSVLNKAKKIDQGDPTTISYLAMVDGEIKEEEVGLSPTELRNKRVAEKAANKDRTPLSGDDVIIPKSSYREYNPATMTIIQIIIGVIIGAAIVFFIVMPAKTKTLRTEYQAQIADLNAMVEELQQEASSSKEEAEDNSTLEASFTALMAAQAAYNEEDYDKAKTELAKVVEDDLNDDLKEYYDEVKSGLAAIDNEEAIQDALQLYQDESYEDAAEALQKLYDDGVKNADVLYYLGRSYDYIDDRTNGKKYLSEFVEEYPDDDNVETANQILTAYDS